MAKRLLVRPLTAILFPAFPPAPLGALTGSPPTLGVMHLFLPLQAPADDAVQVAVNVASPILGVLIGVAAGIVLAFISSMVLKAIFHRARVISALLSRTRGPSYWMFMSWGAYVGFVVTMFSTPDEDLGGWIGAVRTILLVLGIVMTTWVLYSAGWVIEDAARLRHNADVGKSRRFETQAQVLRRLIQALVAVIGVALGLYVLIPGAQQALGALLASAGLISVVAGIAAQSTLGNVFAGIQLAFTDAIRVGDVVVVGQSGDTGAVEEITLTYVVVRIWDERRLVIPSSKFTTESFQNWTRREAKQLGTIELELDWAAPMSQIRDKVEELLLATDLWDGRTWNVQVTNSDRDSITIRVMVSAENSGTLWDLRVYLREHLIAWIASEQPWARPTTRYQAREVEIVERDETQELVARLAAELSGIADTDPADGSDSSNQGGPQEDIEIEDASDPVHAARLKAARRKSKLARRRTMSQRQRELADGTAVATTLDSIPAIDAGDASASDLQRTRRFTTSEIRAITQGAPTSAPEASSAPASSSSMTETSGGKGERLYSGTPDAEERGAIFNGPGQEVIAEREENARLRAEKSGSLTGAAAPRPGQGAPEKDPAATAQLPPIDDAD